MIETPKLLLRKITLQDWPLFLKLHKDERVMRWVSDTLDEPSIHEKFMQRYEDTSTWHKESPCWLTLVVVDKHTGNEVGLHGFYSQWSPYQQAEIGFLLLPEYQGKGYAKAATQAVIDFILKDCSFHKVIATVSEGNIASFSLLKSLGFTHEGTLKDNFKIADQWINDQKLALIANN
ncbi:GNAT family N-acetyltransferase [Pseudoalteromonas sp. S16_S37]|uniref:GNAT family N-acetyltransferase n=1 Tax=Pseudoalteromonas sp. S16_S37 TaxID=2720228 RepID=UPI001681BD16|nr:GNAT family N-acetyltransferase [Pseudoalteromonas sp. S16_S37]MBD1581907.1 GNAT family N-acetyltransferase [Pseudoalteromonas sp. S16_S37]